MINADADRGRALPLPPSRVYRRVKPLGARLLPIRVCGGPLCTHFPHAHGPFGARSNPAGGRDSTRHVGSPKQNRWASQALGATPSFHPSIHPSICVQSPVGTISLLGLLSLLLTAHPWLSFPPPRIADSFHVHVMTRWTSSKLSDAPGVSGAWCDRSNFQGAGTGISGREREGERWFDSKKGREIKKWRIVELVEKKRKRWIVFFSWGS